MLHCAMWQWCDVSPLMGILPLKQGAAGDPGTKGGPGTRGNRGQRVHFY